MRRGTLSPFPRLRQIYAVYVTVLILFSGAGIYLFRTLQDMKGHLSSVAHTQEVLSEIERLVSTLKDAETGIRGFLLTSEHEFLTPYLDAKSRTESELENLRNLIQDNPDQIRLYLLLSGAAREKLAVISEQIQDVESGGQNRRRLIERGKMAMDTVRRTSGEMEQIERALLAQRQVQAKALTVIMDQMFIGSMLLNVALLTMALLLMKRFLKQQAQESWFSGIQGQIALELGRITDPGLHGQTLLEQVAHEVEAQIGTLYIVENDAFRLEATLGASPAWSPPARIMAREGLVGRAASEKQILDLAGAPSTYLKVSSSLGSEEAAHAIVFPIVAQGQVVAVMELGGFRSFSPLQKMLLARLSEYLGTEIRAFLARHLVEHLLAESREQSQRLQVQQEELRVTNEELIQQADLLKRSEAQLEEQQTELEERNSRIEKQNAELKAERSRLSSAFEQLTDSQRELVAKARALEQASRYKSEFLANMSHELRTPLNSVLILGQILTENRMGNLTADQVESARTIVSSGNDLLNLINEVLDLAKIEAGRLELALSDVPVDALLEKLVREFAPQARRKNLALLSEKSGGLPHALHTDRQRLEQILKNFVSNALKFTEAGHIRIAVRRPSAETARKLELKAPENWVAMSIEDTGIGIPADKHGIIFEAFKQADGTTSRRYGGTGLGLSIAKELARLLCGHIDLVSQEGQGSVFTLVVPEVHPGEALSAPEPPRVAPPPAPLEMQSPAGAQSRKADATPPPERPRPEGFEDDRNALGPHDRVIQVVEDEREFAHILRTLAHQHEFKCILSPSGEEALKDATTYHPSGILLDLKLPGMGGMEVLNELKGHPETRHIPVHVISGLDMHAAAYQRGAVGYLVKPVLPDQIRSVLDRVAHFAERKVARLLLVEDDPGQRRAMRELLGGEGISVSEAATGKEAQEHLKTGTFDCMVLDLRLPDMEGLRLLEIMAQDENLSHPPVVVYTGKPLTREEEEKLRRYSDSIIIKGARSPERLLDQTTLFLHQVENELPEDKRAKLRTARNDEKWLEGHTILLTDDDMRNVYALSRALEERGARMEIARNGQEAVDILERGKSVDIVLMDIMMPVMDGFEATQRIRAMKQGRNIPIIMLTAKAMTADRERSFEVGANDYLTKPVDVNRLLSVLRVWMSGKGF